MQCHAMQFTLLEEFGTSGNPAAQFLGTVDSSSPANLLGIKQLWMSPVSASLHATSTAMPSVLRLHASGTAATTVCGMTRDIITFLSGAPSPLCYRMQHCRMQHLLMLWW